MQFDLFLYLGKQTFTSISLVICTMEQKNSEAEIEF